MKYFKVFASNGLCNCEEEWIISTEKDDLDFYDDVLGQYSYESGYAGMENDDDYWTESYEGDDPLENYEDAIAEYSYWEEITYEEFIHLRDEEDWEER